MRETAYPKWPVYGDKEREALNRVLESGVWGTLGNEVKEFNKRFAEYQGAKYGVAVANGTVSLEIILRALEIGPGDEVIVPPYTFNATVSSVLMAGATPVFADIEADTFNIDPSGIEKHVTEYTKAIMPVHIGGRPCDMDAILAVAAKHRLFVIEDAAQACSAQWKGAKAGSIGDAGSFSFQASKNLTAGEGGFITTNDEALYDRCFSIHHCGRDMKNGLWYDHPHLGTNARMTEWQAAILNAQMERLDSQLETRMDNAAYLTRRLKEIPFVATLREDERITKNAYHLYIFRYFADKNRGVTREKFLDALKAEGIPCAPGYVRLYRQGMLRSPLAKRTLRPGTSYDNLLLENTEKACCEEGVWLFQYMLLGTHKDMDDIADAIIKIGENADELPG